MLLEPPHLFLSMLALVVLGNGGIWWLLAKRHASLKAALARDTLRFEEQDLRLTRSAWSPLGAGIQWMSAQVCITDRAAVLFPRVALVGMPQPPIALFRSKAEAAANRRWLVVSFVVEELVIHGAESALTLRAAPGFTRRKLKLRAQDAEALAAALEACLNRTALTAGTRAL